MQNEEPRTKRTAAGIESRNVPSLYVYIYVCIVICYEFEYRRHRYFYRRKRRDFTSFLARNSQPRDVHEQEESETDASYCGMMTRKTWSLDTSEDLWPRW